MSMKGEKMINDKNFNKILELLFGIEGGYSDNTNDKGGKTNYGITQNTFNSWRDMNKLPRSDVKTNLTKEEARNIYYNMYWKESGADKYADPRDAMILFDMAVNSGPQNAKRLFNKSGENFYAMLDNRKQYYDDIIKYDISQMEFKEGWDNRLKMLENNANKMINEGFFVPSYYKELTPFDKGYKGNLTPVDEIPDRDAKRNKYQYNRNKAIEKGFIKKTEYRSPDIERKNDGYELAQVGEPYFKRTIDDLAPWERDDLFKRKMKKCFSC